MYVCVCGGPLFTRLSVCMWFIIVRGPVGWLALPGQLICSRRALENHPPIIEPLERKQGENRGKKRWEEDRNRLVGRQPSGLESRVPGQSRVKQTHLVTCAEWTVEHLSGSSWPIHPHTLHTHTHTAGGRECWDGFMLWSCAVEVCEKEKERNTAFRCAVTCALCLLAGRVKRLTCRHESSSSRTPLRGGSRSHASLSESLAESKPFPACLLKIKVPIRTDEFYWTVFHKELFYIS